MEERTLYEQIDRALFDIGSAKSITFSRTGYDKARSEGEALRALSLHSEDSATYLGLPFTVERDQAEDFKLS